VPKWGDAKLLDFLVVRPLPTAADAIGSRLRSCGTHLEVGDQRINTSDILRLYEAERTQAC
jgi:hypothetical protein